MVYCVAFCGVCFPLVVVSDLVGWLGGFAGFEYAPDVGWFGFWSGDAEGF